jgi:hypothetical protein
MSKLTIFWIVGQNIDYEYESWEFQGLFDTEKKAVGRCENDDFWVAEVILNEFIPTERVEFNNAYYPTLEKG